MTPDFKDLPLFDI